MAFSKMTHRVMLSTFVSASLLLGGVAEIAAPQGIAQADPVDELIASMTDTSRRANEKNEEVKQLEVGLEEGQAKLGELNQWAADLTAQAEQAAATERESRQVVNRLALSRYRGALTDPLTSAFAARNPQNAIDRTAYLATLSQKANDTVARLGAVTKGAADRRNEATMAIAESKFKQSELEKKHRELLQEQEELKRISEDLRRRVESLNAADRQRWIDKNGPVAYNLDGVAGSPSGMSALEAAMSKLGSPYGWGSAGPSQFDCSGLVYWSYQQQGKTLPRTSQAQMAGGTPVSINDLQPGDVVGYFPGATHVGIYAGNGMLVHASDYGIPVQVVPVNSMPIYGARRY